MIEGMYDTFFEIEEEEVLRVGATFRTFLKDSAMVAYHDDDLGDYLDKTIQQEYEKQPGLRDEELISRLEKSKMFYEEEKMVIEMALREFGNRKGFTREQIDEVQEDLFKLKHFGQSLYNTFSNMDRESKEADYWDEKRQVYNGRGSWKSKPVEEWAAPAGADACKDVQVRRVRIAKGQQQQQQQQQDSRSQAEKPSGEGTGESKEATGESKEATGEAKEAGAGDRDERSERRERREKKRSHEYQLRSRWRFDDIPKNEDEEDIVNIV